MASSPSVSLSPSSNAEENFEPTQMEENPDDVDTMSQEVDQNAATQVPFEESLDFGDTQIDTEAPTQVDFQETQIDTDAPTQVDFDTEEATQIVAEETISEEIDPGEMTQTDTVDPDAPTQLFDSMDNMDEPTQVEDEATEIPTQVENIIDDSDAPTQIEVEGIDAEAPTQVEDANERRSRSGSRSSAARSRSGSASSRSKSRSVSRSRSRSRSVGSRSRSGSPRSRSGSPRSRSGSPRSPRSRSGSPRSRSGSPKSRSASRSVTRSRSRSKSKSKSRSRSRSGSRSRSSSSSSSRSKKSRSRSRSDSEDDIGKAKKRAVKEAFGSDNEDKGDDSDVENAAKKKRKRIVNNDDEDSQEEKAPEEGQEDQDRPAAENTAALPPDSSSDEGITDAPGGGGGAGEFMSDFDMMMERKRAERRRRRKKDIDLINDNDDAIAKMIADMRLAAREDRDLNGARQPATKKISMLPVVMTQLKKADLQMAFVEANVLSVLTDWLAPMPDKSLPSIQIRKAILKLLHELRIDDHSRLKESGIGKAVMYLYKHPRELRENKELAGKIINQWARPIFNLSTDFKSITKEERQERDEMVQTTKKRQQEQAADPEENLRPGDQGWCYRARVPQVQTASYVKRPQWGSEVEFSKKKGRGANKSKMDKYIKVAVAQKQRLKTKRAVDISIEGRKMAL